MQTDTTNLNTNTSSQHEHANNMLLYALDAMQSNTPWENWEHRCKQLVDGFIDAENNWETLGTNPSWSSKVEYRRKSTALPVTLQDQQIKDMWEFPQDLSWIDSVVKLVRKVEQHYFGL